jgi:hypothetical protein
MDYDRIPNVSNFPPPLPPEVASVQSMSSTPYATAVDVTARDAPFGSGHGPGPRVMGASTLTGDSVKNPAGDTIGEIKEIMLDVPMGGIAYAVMSFGGFLGMGDKLFAVPWLALQMDPPNKCFVLNVTKEQLEAAPGFDKDHWPSMADETWARQVHQHYHTKPYWE